MKKFPLALCAALTLTAGSLGVANAVEFGVGPGGVYVAPYGPYYDHDYNGGCRVVITRHFNRWGDRVTVRRRICG
jgi:hypothetical protein